MIHSTLLALTPPVAKPFSYIPDASSFIKFKLQDENLNIQSLPSNENVEDKSLGQE